MKPLKKIEIPLNRMELCKALDEIVGSGHPMGQAILDMIGTGLLKFKASNEADGVALAAGLVKFLDYPDDVIPPVEVCDASAGALELVKGFDSIFYTASCSDDGLTHEGATALGVVCDRLQELMETVNEFINPKEEAEG